MNEQIKIKMQYCLDNKQPQLDLSRLGLTEIPPEIAEFIWLNSLNIHGNQIRNISVLSSLSNLRCLNCRDNLIDDLSPLIDLRYLHELYCGNNLIVDPRPIVKMTRLTKIDCHGNKFQFSNNDAISCVL